MRIIDIKQMLPNDKFVRAMLMKGMRSEALFSKVFFGVVVEIDHPRDMFNRWLWECEYLRLDDPSFCSVFPDAPTQLMMQLTLSEALDYIYRVTPPLLQSKIKESITTPEDIREVLKTFLMEDSSQKKYYDSTFYTMTHLNVETMGTHIDKSYCDLIREHVPTDPIVHIKYRDKNGTCATFHCNNKHELESIVEMLNGWNTGDTNTPRFQLIDFLYDPNSGYYIDLILYTPYNANYPDMRDPAVDIFNQIEKRSYEWM